MCRTAVRTAVTAAKAADVIFEVDEGLEYPDRLPAQGKILCPDREKKAVRNAVTVKMVQISYLKVPEGTVIKDAESGKVIADMSGDNRTTDYLKRWHVAETETMHYATATMQVPKYAQPGQPAQRTLGTALELKVIADVGLVGFPNVGKSTLLSRVTNARPKIANYHFTTLNPNLGVVDLRWRKGLCDRGYPGTDRRRFGRCRTWT